MAGLTKESGITITWMGSESINGPMVENTLENIRKTRNTATVYTNGMMEGNIWATGLSGNSMG